MATLNDIGHFIITSDDVRMEESEPANPLIRIKSMISLDSEGIDPGL